MTTVDVVGTAIASLVAVDALAAAGHEVRWIRPPGPLSGGFQPLKHEGRDLELGMRLIELSYDDTGAECDRTPEPPLEEYQPGPHGHRPYLGTVERLVRDLAGPGLHSVDAPSCWVKGTIGADYVVVGDLSDLNRFVDPRTQERIAAETAAAIADLGARGVHELAANHPRWNDSLSVVGPSQTGPTFWRTLIEPLLDAIVGPVDIPAARHRKVWMPLFHPGTVHEAATDRLTYRPERPLYTVADGGVHQILQRLERRVLRSPQVTVLPVGAITGLRADGPDVTITLDEGRSLISRRPIVGIEPRQLFNAAGVSFAPERAWSTIVWVDTDPRESDRDLLPSVEWVIDDRIPAYRVSQNGAESATEDRRTWIVELRHDMDGDAEAEAERSIRQLGLGGDATKAITSVRVPSFVVPDRANEERFVAARQAFDELGLDVHLVGGAVAFAVDSLNEQIVQGLQATAMASASTTRSI